jgi:hypothetical protein
MATQGKGLLAVWTDIPAHIGDFNRWYDEEQFAGARRYSRIFECASVCVAARHPKYLAPTTIDAQVLQSDPYLVLGNSTLDTAHPPALSEFCAQRV